MTTTDLLAVSVGCPAGIGPEVAVLAAAETRIRCVLVGDPAVIERAAVQRGVDTARLAVVPDIAAARALPPAGIAIWGPSERIDLPTLGEPSEDAGRAQLAWIDRAADLVSAGDCVALVTGPASKAAIVSGGHTSFRGHTEYLANRWGADEVVMAFTHPHSFSVSVATTHIPLSEVARQLDADRVARACYWLARLLASLRNKAPMLAVAGLNPHAGEGGLMGDEEERVISPGIERALERLAAEERAVELVGPLGAETAFRKANDGAFDGVVAMYHDQATIACKLAGFGEAVNVTLGLPHVRTSVDHGTGYDIAGSGFADPRGMAEALRVAQRLAQRLGRQSAPQSS